MQVYVETHYYEGGFASCLLPRQRRPAILPDADQTGLRSTDGELAKNDYALELSRFTRESHSVNWIGCYTRGIDLLHGDRGNYCGAGIWLIDAIPVDCVRIVEFLRTVASRLSQGKIGLAEIHAKLTTFVDDFDSLGWCIPLNRRTSARALPARDTNDARKSNYLVLLDAQKSSFDLAAIDMLGQFVAQPAVQRASRRVYFLAPHSSLYVGATESIGFRDATVFAERIARQAMDDFQTARA